MNIEDIAQKLLELSEQGRLDWGQETEQRFSAEVGKMRLTISQGWDEDTEVEVYNLTIYNLGSFAGDQYLDSIYADRYRGPISTLERVYAAARRNALNIHMVLDDLGAELDKLSSK